MFRSPAGLAAFGVSASAQAGAITPWSGASTSVHVLDQTKTDEGISAAVEASAKATIPYESIYPGTIYSAPVQGSASAQATGHPNELLRLDATYFAPNPGTWPTGYQKLPVMASASWSGDSVQLQALQRANLPQQIRLNFGITYGVHSTIRNLRPNYEPSVNLHYSGTTHGYDNLTWNTDWGHLFHTGTFHIDLPIHTDGVSDPFSLSVSTDVGYGLFSNLYIQNDLSDLAVSLKDITLPDGTSLTDAGYGVSFASGMAWPQPHAVPEPASVAVWVGLAAAGWWGFGKKCRLRK